MKLGSDARPIAVLATVVSVGMGLLVAGGTFVYGAVEPGDGLFQGWQLIALSMGFALVAVALAGVCAALGRRAVRRLPGLSYLVILPAVMVGLLLGGLPRAAASPALRWASDQTHGAAAQRLVDRTLRNEDPRAPRVFTTGGNRADPQVARGLLTVPELGPGWYTAQEPSPRADDSPGAYVGAGLNAKLAHWTGKEWHTDSILFETTRTYPSAAAAAAVLTTENAPFVGGCGCVVHVVTLDGQRVVMREFTYPISAHLTGEWRTGARVWQLNVETSYDGHVMTRAEVHRITSTAVARSL